MQNLTIKKEVLLPAPPKDVFDFLTTPGKVKLVLPGLVEVRNTPPGNMKEGDTFDYTYRMFGILLKGSWSVQKAESPRIYSAKTSGETSSEWNYTIEESGNGSKLNLQVSYQIPQTLLGKVEKVILSALNEKEIEHYFENLQVLFQLAKQN